MEDPGVGGIILKWASRSRNGGMDWIDLAQDRRRALINAVINLLGCIKCGGFLDSLRTC